MTVEQDRFLTRKSESTLRGNLPEITQSLSPSASTWLEQHQPPKLAGQIQHKETIFAPQVTRDFLLSSIAEEAHLKTPQGIYEETWIRNRNILGTYFASRATLAEVGGIYGLTGERIRQIIEKGIEYLWNQSSKDTRVTFPLDNILKSKGPSIFKSLRQSETRGGSTLRIYQFVKGGRSIEEIINEIGVSKNNLQASLRRMKGWGLDVPEVETSHSRLRSLAEKLTKPSLTDQEARELLSRATINFYLSHSQGENPLFASGGAFLRSLGLHFKNNDFPLLLQVLRDNNVPIGKVNTHTKTGPQKGIKSYYFILTVHHERALQALLSDQRSQKFLHNPVKQIYGPESTIPTTTQIVKKRKLSRVGEVFRMLGITYRGNVTQNIDLLANCPVPIYEYDGQFFFPSEQQEALKEFVLSKLVPKGT